MPRSLLAVLCALALAFAPACGDDDDTAAEETPTEDRADGEAFEEDGPQGFTDEGPAESEGNGPVDEWTDEVCGSFLSLAKDAESLIEDPELASIFSEEEFDATDTAAVEDALQSLEGVFGKFAALIRTTADEVDEVGAPDTEGGEEYQAKIVAALGQAAELLNEAQRELAAVDATSIASLEELRAELSGFQEAFEALPDLDFEDGTAEIAAAYEAQPNCQEGEARFGDDDAGTEDEGS
ncbi:hypothetical protein BH24ACT3_BH24ACT3_10300 [soil metagenome]